MLLLVIQMDVVVGDIGQIRRREIELRRIDVLALGALHREIQIGRESPGRVVDGEFRAVLLAEAVVERRQNDGCTELALVDQIHRLLVVAVRSDRQRSGDFLLHAEIVVVRMLRQRRSGLRRSAADAVVFANSAMSLPPTSSKGGGER